MFRKIKAIHFIGIGGSGMSGIAEILLTSGYEVSGSDMRASGTTDRLRELGAKVFIGHDAGHIRGVEVVVVSSAIKQDNPELIAAQYRGIPVIPRAEMLAELMRMKYGIAVAGAHGKTTTTSMLAHILGDSDLDPTIIIGGRLNKYNSNAKLGKGALMLAEADESDGSFLRLSPTICIVTNLDEEHLDHYKNGIEEIAETFLEFMNKVPFHGLVIACTDDDRLAQLLPRVRRKVLTYGLKGGADISAANIRAEGTRMRYELMVRGAKLGEVELSVPGKHNVANSLAAIAIGLEFDLPLEAIVASLCKFTGADRRFHVIGEVEGRLLVDDYAHHPTEIQATLDAAKNAYKRRVVGVFQPHRYSRLRDCWDRFLDCFRDADKVLILPVYTAGESKLPNIDSDRFAQELAERNEAVVLLDDLAELGKDLVAHTEAGDLVLALGAGSISGAIRQVYDEWVTRHTGGRASSKK